LVNTALRIEQVVVFRLLALLAGTLHAARSGIVVDASTGNPIAGATVFVYWGTRTLKVALRREPLVEVRR
jgi:hypothetical protein